MCRPWFPDSGFSWEDSTLTQVHRESQMREKRACTSLALCCLHSEGIPFTIRERGRSQEPLAGQEQAHGPPDHVNLNLNPGIHPPLTRPSQLLSSACIYVGDQGSPLLETTKQIFLTWFPVPIKINPKFLQRLLSFSLDPVLPPPTGTPFQPHWPSRNTPRTFFPQGLARGVPTPSKAPDRHPHGAALASFRSLLKCHRFSEAILASTIQDRAHRTQLPTLHHLSS